MVTHITDKIVKALQPPVKAQKITYDDDITGFGVGISYTGAKTFLLNYSLNGHERRYLIGKYPAWSVSAARDRAAELRRLIDTGKDPQAAKVADRQAVTVKDMFVAYQKTHMVNLGKANQSDIMSMWRDWIIPSIGNKRLKDLTSRDVDSLHRLISKTAPVRANRVLANLRSVLNLAVRWGDIEKNPALSFRRNPEEGKNTFLTSQEINVVFDCLKKMANKQAANVIRLLIFTGARKGEALSAEWSHFDLDRGTWTKPRSKTKQKKIHSVPLSVEAVALLQGIKDEQEARAESTNTSPPTLVFVSRTGKALIDIKRPWAWLQKEAKQDKLRIHDLRHTYASLLISDGESLPVIGRLLGHSQASTTMRYAHLLDDPLRKATAKIGKLGAN